MIFSLFIIRKIEPLKHEIASLLAHISFYWMGFLILFVMFSTALLLMGIFYKPFLNKQTNFAIACTLSLAFVGFGYMKAQTIHIRSINIKSKKIKKDMRIVFFSDAHVGLMVKGNYVEKIAKKINNLNPDLVIAGGDIIDSSVDGIEKNIEPLKTINPRYGKYTVFGNHEFYRGISKCQTQLQKANFIILRNACAKVNDFLSIAGIDDITITNAKDEEILDKCDKNTFVIFVKHRPIFENNTYRLFDLALSGHTHAGQMFPFTILTKIFYHGRDFGFFKINGSNLIVSSGVGTWGPPFRILSSSEIVLINLEQ